MSKFEHKVESVRCLDQNYKDKIYIPSKLQRDITAWTLNQKKDYIRSIFNDMIPSTIVLIPVSVDPNPKYYIHDGLQRIDAIKQFKQGFFPITLDVKEDGEDGKVFSEIYYYKATKACNANKVLSINQKNQFNNSLIHVLYSTNPLPEKIRRDLFLNIQKGTPVNEYTLYKSTNGNISKLVFEFIRETSKENKDAVKEFKEMYEDDLYFKILSDLCVYLNDPESSPNSLKYYNDNYEIKTEFIRNKLANLITNFETFISIINTYLDPIQLTTALIWYTEMVNKSDQEYVKELKIFERQIEKLKQENSSVKWKYTEKYESHLSYLKNRIGVN